MSKNQILTFIAFILISLISCKSGPDLEVQKMYDDVMSVHDKVMPKMAEVNRLKRQLNAYRNAVPDENATLKDSLINAQLVLAKSEDMMDNWMKNFDAPLPTAPKADAIKYLTAQKDSITKVSDDIFMSIAIANGFLNHAPDSIKSK